MRETELLANMTKKTESPQDTGGAIDTDATTVVEYADLGEWLYGKVVDRDNAAADSPWNSRGDREHFRKLLKKVITKVYKGIPATFTDDQFIGSIVYEVDKDQRWPTVWNQKLSARLKYWLEEWDKIAEGDDIDVADDDEEMIPTKLVKEVISFLSDISDNNQLSHETSLEALRLTICLTNELDESSDEGDD